MIETRMFDRGEITKNNLNYVFDEVVEKIKMRIKLRLDTTPLPSLDYENDLMSWLETDFYEIDGKSSNDSSFDDFPENTLQELAFTKAKLEMICDTACDVYPGLELKIKEYMDYLSSTGIKLLDSESAKNEVHKIKIYGSNSLMIRRFLFLIAVCMIGTSSKNINAFSEDKTQSESISSSCKCVDTDKNGNIVEVDCAHFAAIICEPNLTESSANSLNTLGNYDQDGTLWVHQDNLPFAFKYGYGHLFQAVAVFDQNSDCSQYGLKTCAGALGYAHGTTPGSQVDGFEVVLDPYHPGTFLYYVLKPLRILSDRWGSE